MAGELQFAAFLSYSRKDVRLASWLVRSLEEFRLPRQTVDDLKARSAAFIAARPIFRDEHDMPVGGAISDRLGEVLEASATMIVLCTASSVKSDWVNREIELFSSRHPDRRIIPVVAEGEPDSDGSYPPALLKLGKPLAADIRNPVERRQSIIKIAAAVLGLDVDQLVGRMQKHRVEQRRLFAAVGGVATAVVIGLAVTAGVMAGNAKQANDRAFAQVEQLLTKTRADMDDLAAKKALHEAAKLYFDSKEGRRLSDRDLLLKAEWLRQEGEDAGKRREDQEALTHRQNAYAATAELLKRDPDNPHFLFSHGQSAYWMGFYYFERRQPDLARPFLEVYEKTAEDLFARQPDYASATHGTDARLEVHYARVNIGMLDVEQNRDPRSAAVAFSSALEILDTRAEGLEAKLNLSRGYLNYVSALAQFAPAAEVLAVIERWRPLLSELEDLPSSSPGVDFHLANSWDKILKIEDHVDQRGGNQGRLQTIAKEEVDQDPDDIVSLTFAAELRLRAGDAPRCSELPPVSKASLTKSEELRLTSECIPALPRDQQLERCQWFATSLKSQAPAFALEPVWAQFLAKCSRTAEKMRNRDLSRAVGEALASKFTGRQFEQMRLWTQFALVDFAAAEPNAWITDLKDSLDRRGWTTNGEN